jgi:hypothetical protein
MLEPCWQGAGSVFDPLCWARVRLPGLLGAELVTGEGDDAEALVGVLVVQLHELRVVRLRPPALARAHETGQRTREP